MSAPFFKQENVGCLMSYPHAASLNRGLSFGETVEPYLAVALAATISVNYFEFKFYGGSHTSVIGFALDCFH